jgi:hypothetical protein
VDLSTPLRPSETGTPTLTPSIPYSPSSTTEAGQTSLVGRAIASTIRATPSPEVQVELRAESSATWRTYQADRRGS